MKSKKFWVELEHLRSGEAMYTLFDVTDGHKEWSGSGVVCIKSNDTLSLENVVYKNASLSARDKGGVIDRFYAV